MTDIDANFLRSVIDYDATTGIFTWRERADRLPQWNARFAGKTAGYCGAKGYWMIPINDRAFRAHRLAWLWMTGEWPKDQIDHRDLQRSNNRWRNLREATNAENNRNRGADPRNRSGRKGVDWNKRDQRWRAQIKVNGKKIHLGNFHVDKLDEAAAAYAKAAEKYHGEFARVA